MQITVINNSSNPVACPDYVNCAAGATRVMTGRTIAEYGTMMASSSALVIVIGTLEDADLPPLVCDQKDPGDPPGGQDYQTGLGFDLENPDTTAANADPQMYFGVFDDAACTTPAANATLGTATAGTIDAGDGTNLLTVTPTAAGEFACRVDDTTDETVYFRAWPVSSNRPIDCSEIVDIEFTT